MSADFSELRPWTMGELLDRAASLWRRRLKPLFQLMLGFQLVVFVITKAYVVVGQRYFPMLMTLRGVTEAQRGGSAEVLRQTGVAVGVLAVVYGLWVLVGWSANLVLSRFIVDDVVGRGGDPRAAWRRLRRRMGALLGVFVVVHVWAALVMFAALIPGVLVIGLGVATSSDVGVVAGFAVGTLLLLLGVALSWLWYFLRFLLVPTVLAVEERSVFGTIRRSGELISGRIGPGFLDRVFVRATIVVTVIFAILIVVSIVLSVPAGIVQVIFGNILDPKNATPESVPQLLLVPAELFEAVCAAVIVPVSSVLAALFYLDMRMRREGLDLDLKLTALEGAPK